jgi:hypothetical protein
MGMNKREIIIFILGAVLGILSGFFIGKGIYDRPLVESVTRDTTTTIDTIPDITPTPTDSAPVKTVIRWLPMKLPKKSGTDKESVGNPYPASTDTLSQWQLFGNSEHPHDSALVEIPITSKHYQSPEYDAWVSGFEPSLDSIKVYQKTQVITETITRMKPPNKWELDLVGGINYEVYKKKYTPHIGGELLYKPNRFQIGIRGGIEYQEKIEPFLGAVAKIRIL